MATYTIRLVDLLKTGFEIWDSENPFPIFSESYRQPLQSMIENHYFMQEIGTETPGNFKRLLNQRMREIMPYYNALYLSKIDWSTDPLVTYKSAVHDTGNTGTDYTAGKMETVTGQKTDIHYGFDTPMNASAVTSPDHMSSAANDQFGQRTDTHGHAAGQKDTTENEHTNDITTTINGLSIYEQAEQYRAMIYDIDRRIIDELGDLFMMVF